MQKHWKKLLDFFMVGEATSKDYLDFFPFRVISDLIDVRDSLV